MTTKKKMKPMVVLTQEQYHHLHSFTKMFKGRITGLPKDTLAKK